MGTTGRSTVEILYQLGPPFCWDSIEVGNWGTYRTLVQQVVAVIGIKLFQFCLSDEKIAIIGMFSAVGYFIMEGFSKTTFHLYLVPVVGCFQIAAIAMFRSIMSKMTPAHFQGKQVFRDLSEMLNCHITLFD
ncbi:hypothetical protein FSP39_003448 [Pinctada imbricata]|uniref:Uncharacterized protein n=1 Tax=Pinctada imbricata TaxID=66713 RepID=A0AA89BVL2_PINIB|nr:hypothetical protein FSP39_003448 [Pinctada imbricata]